MENRKIEKTNQQEKLRTELIAMLFMITAASQEDRERIVALLELENLPKDDLPDTMQNFFIAKTGDDVVGAIGLEQYQDSGLLRSMVVNKTFRKKRIRSDRQERSSC